MPSTHHGPFCYAIRTMWRATHPVLSLVATFALLACSPGNDNDATRLNIPARMHAGKVHLTNFEGAAAREAFLPVADHFRRTGSDASCPGAFGLALADFQIVLARLNPVLETLVRDGAIVPPPAEEPGGDGWAEWSTFLAEAAEYAGAVTAAACSFDIGISDADAEADLTYTLYVLGNTVPTADVRVVARFDGAEARVMAALAEAALGAGDIVFAHDLTFDLSEKKFAHQLGVTEACIREDWLRCLDKVAADHTPVNLLDWAFVFEDNPAFLKAAPAWDEHMGRAPRRFAAAMRMLRTVFPALLARSVAFTREERDAGVAEEFALRYVDADEDDAFGRNDILGVNVAAVTLDCTVLVELEAAPWPQEECERRLGDYTALINTAGLPILATAASPDKPVVAELQRLFDGLHANFTAVDEPAYPHGPLAFTTLNRLMTEFVPLFDAPAPAFAELDVRAFFVEPRPVRSFVPVWTKTGPTGARFLADSDDYTYLAPPPTTVTLPQAYLDEAYGGIVWALIGRDYEVAYDATSVTERNLLACPGPYCTPADCLNAANLYTEISAELLGLGAGTERIAVPAMNAWFPDASLNGLVRIDEAAWTSSYGPGNGAGTWEGLTCMAEAGFAPATNYTLHRAGWLFVDFALDHFAFLPLVIEALPR